MNINFSLLIVVLFRILSDVSQHQDVCGTPPSSFLFLFGCAGQMLGPIG